MDLYSLVRRLVAAEVAMTTSAGRVEVVFGRHVYDRRLKRERARVCVYYVAAKNVGGRVFLEMGSEGVRDVSERSFVRNMTTRESVPKIIVPRS